MRRWVVEGVEELLGEAWDGRAAGGDVGVSCAEGWGECHRHWQAIVWTDKDRNKCVEVVRIG